MKFFRGFLGFILFVLVALTWEQNRNRNESEVIQPQYERSTLEGRDFVYYTVQPGDTLSMLEKKFRIPTREAIRDLNPDINSEELPVNKQIKIPLK
ncbi:LysM peptidoglycan-binding domain-containing protein [bacterium]|nr:LysM peptidoglycan-binding domain-containing protein [bacterium]